MLLEVADVAERLKVTTATVYKLLVSGKLKSFKIGNRYRISEEDLKKYMEQASETLRTD